MLAGKTIAVTGATGFLGRYLVDALLARGARVVAAVRNVDRARGLAVRGVVLRKADLVERERLAEAFAGVDAVVSNAALLSLLPRAWQEYVRVNVEGTENVFEAMATAGVRRAVQLSSVAVYRGHSPPVAEDHPRLDTSVRGSRFNAYPLSKALSEDAAWRIARARGIALTVLRPPGIYGAFDTNFTRVHKLLVTHLPVAPYPVMRLCMVYAGDVAEAAVRALEEPAAEGRAYNVTGDDLTTWQFAAAWRQAGGKSARLVPVPVPYRRIYSSDRARRELGWTPRSYQEGIQEVLVTEGAAGVT
jgi:nucleoside-diphosphate-sugar epimerase